MNTSSDRRGSSSHVCVARTSRFPRLLRLHGSEATRFLSFFFLFPPLAGYSRARVVGAPAVSRRRRSGRRGRERYRTPAIVFLRAGRAPCVRSLTITLFKCTMYSALAEAQCNCTPAHARAKRGTAVVVFLPTRVRRHLGGRPARKTAS